VSENTVFDRILRREAPARIVHEDEDVLAFQDLRPQAPVHVLVIPKRRASSFAELEQRGTEEVGRFFQGVARVARLLELEAGYRVVLNNGAQAQQSVAYLHAHILGGRQMRWPPG
jgi:histidine triad (HIT) family protein